MRKHQLMDVRVIIGKASFHQKLVMDITKPFSYFLPFAQKKFKIDSAKDQYLILVKSDNEWKHAPLSSSLFELDLQPNTEIVIADKDKPVENSVLERKETDTLISLSGILQFDKKKRQVVLDGNTLNVHKTSEGEESKMISYHLPDYYMSYEGEKKEKAPTIELASVKTRKSIHQIKFNSEEEASLWVEHLRKFTSTEMPPSGGTSPRSKQTIPYFGGKLEVALTDGREIPYVVEHCINLLRERALEVEGIFRLSGSQVQIEKYRNEFNCGVLVDLSNEVDPHTIAGVLKLYFREMEEPLLTYDLYDSFISTQNERDRIKRARILRKLVQGLPKGNKATLKYLISFLAEIVKHSDTNKMAVHNVATVFAPNILKSSDGNILNVVQDSPLVNSTISSLIEDYSIIFSDKEPPEIAPKLSLALYDYEAKSDNEVSLKKGEVVHVHEERDKGWWYGEVNGKYGLFPGSYVEVQDQSMSKKQQFLLELKNMRNKLEQNKLKLENLKQIKKEILEEEENLGQIEKASREEASILKKTIKAVISHNEELSQFKHRIEDLSNILEAYHKTRSSMHSSRQALLDELSNMKKVLMTDKFKKIKEKLIPNIDAVLKQFEEEQNARKVTAQIKDQIYTDIVHINQIISQ